MARVLKYASLELACGHLVLDTVVVRVLCRVFVFPVSSLVAQALLSNKVDDLSNHVSSLLASQSSLGETVVNLEQGLHAVTANQEATAAAVRGDIHQLTQAIMPLVHAHAAATAQAAPTAPTSGPATASPPAAAPPPAPAAATEEGTQYGRAPARSVQPNAPY